ncbi:MAG TPA: hypothetical protein DCS28_00495 [Candidatus Moranbacteria bacterium]|nr:hypothetical protein [Candidatus Moranbacteria bacterium]HAT74509.1 hypothetical protein [Candidatus Moranbacteria bacterium]
MDNITKHKWFKGAALTVAFILAVLLSFAGGVKVGSHKALFSCRWGENYEKNFMGQRNGLLGGGGMMKFMRDQFEGRGFRNAHGLAGTIISIADNNLIVKDKDGKENTVAVTDSTLINKNRFVNLKLSDLKPDDKIVIMGKPDDSGVINAILIRVFDTN